MAFFNFHIPALVPVRVLILSISLVPFFSLVLFPESQIFGQETKSSVEEDEYVSVYSFMTMTTGVHISLPKGDPKKSEELFNAAKAAIVNIENLMSPKGTQSDVFKLNSALPNEWVEVSPLTIKVMEECIVWYKNSKGAFDPGAGKLIGLFRYDRGTLEKWPEKEVIKDAIEHGGMDKLEIDKENSRIRKLDNGVILDLGAAAKGFAVDQALLALKEKGAESALVEIGGEVGTLGLTPKSEPWRVKIDDPKGLLKVPLAFELSNSVVATSGGNLKYFQYELKKYSHIIDPRTGTPLKADEVMQVTIAYQGSCLLADILSTSIFVLGPNDGLKMLADWSLDNPKDAEGLQAVILYAGEGGGNEIKFIWFDNEGTLIQRVNKLK
jgi:thiamine biosynthesis lipoprotein